MPDSPAPDPARSLLSEALLFLSACGIDVIVDWDASGRRFYVDGVAVTEGEIVARAVALGLFGGAERMQ